MDRTAHLTSPREAFDHLALLEKAVMTMPENSSDLSREPADIFFTFLDGSLGYDCASCGQFCCRRIELCMLPAEAIRSGPQH